MGYLLSFPHASGVGVVGEEHFESAVFQPGPTVAAGVVGDLQRDEAGNQRPGTCPGQAPMQHVAAISQPAAGREHGDKRILYELLRDDDMFHQQHCQLERLVVHAVEGGQCPVGVPVSADSRDLAPDALQVRTWPCLRSPPGQCPAAQVSRHCHLGWSAAPWALSPPHAAASTAICSKAEAEPTRNPARRNQPRRAPATVHYGPAPTSVVGLDPLAGNQRPGSAEEIAGAGTSATGGLRVTCPTSNTPSRPSRGHWTVTGGEDPSLWNPPSGPAGEDQAEANAEPAAVLEGFLASTGLDLTPFCNPNH